MISQWHDGDDERADGAPTPLAVVTGDPTAVSALTTARLSALWRKSMVGLLLASEDAEALAEVVTARAVLLAELERRDPVSMAAWLVSGAEEPDGPPAYLLGVRSMSSRER